MVRLSEKEITISHKNNGPSVAKKPEFYSQSITMTKSPAVIKSQVKT